MANKKTLKSGGLWCQEDLVELIAWLDHTLQHDNINFLETAVDHLKESRQKKFSLSQVEDKLRRQWRPGQSGVGWKDDVYTHGSSCLLGLDNDTKEAIASIFRALEEGYYSSQLFHSHRLRSRSVPTNSGSNRLASSEHPKSLYKRTPIQLRQRTQTLSLTPSTVKREIDTTDDGSRQNSVSKKRKRKVPIVHLTHSTITEDNSQTLSAEGTAIKEHLPKPSTPQRELVIHDSEDEETQRSKSLTLVPQVAEQSDASPCPSGETLLGHHAGSTTGLLNQNINRNFAAAITDLKEQLYQRESQIRELEENVAKLQAEVEILQSVQNQRDMKDGQPLHARIEDKDRTIKRLREELNDRRYLGTFTKILATSRDWNSDGHGMVDVVAGFRNVYAECKQVLCLYNSGTAAIIPPLDQHEGLRSLIMKGLELDPHTPLELEKMSIDLPKLNLQALVRALMTIALREWVFETDFPVFTKEVSDVLTKYKEHIAKQDGASSLRRLDLSVQDSLIKNDRFRRTIPEKAEKLAMQLSKDLAPLFPNSEALPETSWDGFATWGQDTKEWEERRIRLVDIFQKALELKADSVLNMLDYQMVMFPTKMKYDKNLMEIETMEGMVDYRERGSGIELCIEAAVYAYPRTELQDSAPMSEAIVPSRNFVRMDAKQRSNVRPIVKAVVILKEDAMDGAEM